MANYTDITTRPGKGPRAHRNVSNPAYREGWDRIFSKPAKPKRMRPAECDCGKCEGVVKCPECEGYGELPVGRGKIMCPACDGEGKVIYAD